jgi:uncharacterized cupin superfamily protein
VPKIDIDKIAPDTRTGYPAEFKAAVNGRSRKRLGQAAGLDQFGVNLSTLKPGAASSLKHWHQHEDELVYVLEGEVVLVEDGGEIVLKPGDAAGWKAGAPNGHCLVNRSQRDAIFLEIGSRRAVETANYPDLDLVLVRNETGARFTKKNGEPYPAEERR